jgi:uncharacterized protein YecE (DUF72 family)
MGIFSPVTIRIGTSGYSYKAWKGVFYPDNLKAADMLSFYSTQLGTVEINNTFYRMPTPRLLEGWAPQVPDTFRFVLKMSQKITHFKRLKEVDEEVGTFVRNAGGLGAKLGAILVQIPPNLARDDERLKVFLSLVPRDIKVALEVRNASWLVPEVYAILERRGVSLVTSQTDEEPDVDVVQTAPWGYVRLRKTSYAPEEIAAWANRIGKMSWEEAFVFFKHEQIGPGLAAKLSAATGE